MVSRLLLHSGVAITTLLAPDRSTTSMVPDAANVPTLAAEPAPVLSLLTVDLWPEYDDPRVLVIYRGRLEPGAGVPVDLSLIVPADAQVHMAGSVGRDGEHVHAAYETRPRPDGTVELSYSLELDNFWVEFYYDPLGDGTDRAFTYRVIAPFYARMLMVNVQQPLRSEDFELTPFTPQVVQDQKGMLYYVIQQVSVSAGSSTPIDVVYRKADREPSVQRADAAADPGARDLGTTNLLVFAAVILVGVAAHALYLGFAPGEGPEERAEIEEDPGGTLWFCMHCGRPLESLNRYCGACGRASGAAGGASS